MARSHHKPDTAARAPASPPGSLTGCDAGLTLSMRRHGPPTAVRNPTRTRERGDAALSSIVPIQAVAGSPSEGGTPMKRIAWVVMALAAMVPWTASANEELL